MIQRPIRKLMIFGRPGSGKSTFAHKSSQATGLPLYHLDKYFFTNNWVERDKSTYIKIEQSIISKECWIIDGNSTKSLQNRWAQADLVLYFNYNKVQCLMRLIQRRIFSPKYPLNDHAPGCEERLSLSLIKYAWNFEKRVASKIEELLEKYPHTPFFEINSRQKLEVISKNYKLL